MKYLIFETELGSKTRSAQEAANRGAHNEDVTRYWWRLGVRLRLQHGL
jgi:hypothetical protein